MRRHQGRIEIVTEESKDENLSLHVEIWPLDGEEHPINWKNLVEEAIHNRLHSIAKDSKN